MFSYLCCVLLFFSSVFSQYENVFWTPHYGLVGYRRLPFNDVTYGSTVGLSKEIGRLAAQMTSLVSNVQSDRKQVSDVISVHNKRMADIARQMTELAKNVAEMATVLSNAARGVSDLVRDGEERARIRSREMTTTAVNLAEFAKRLSEREKQCLKSE